MSALDRVKIEEAMREVGRVMSMLSLVAAALRMEEGFQEEHGRPSVAEEPISIPSVGEMAETVEACRHLLNGCYENLARKGW